MSLYVIVVLAVCAGLATAQALYEGKGPVKGTNKLFASINDRPSARGHRAFVLFNALSKDIPCRICQPMQDTFEMIAESVKNKAAIKLAFVHMDLATTRDSFIRMRIQNVPQLFYYDTTGEPKTYDLRLGAEPEEIIKFVEESAGIKLVFETKLNTQLIYQSIIIAVLLCGFAIRFRSSLLAIVSSAVVRGAAAVIFCTLMTSGTMWNRIRKPAPFGYGPGGATEYINSSLQQQYGLESQIVFAILMWGSVSLMAVPLLTPGIKNVRAKRAAVLFSMASFMAASWSVVSIFRKKVPGYPFKILI